MGQDGTVLAPVKAASRECVHSPDASRCDGLRPALTGAALGSGQCCGRDEKTVLQPNQKTL
jgi:hypothetical protein